jgi:regulatory protein
MKLTERSLENAALHYLQRYAATRSSLRRVLLNKIRRVPDARPEQALAVRALVDPLVERYVAAGLIDDAVFAANRASSLRRRCGSTRAIRQKLLLKGVDKQTIARVVPAERDEELAAARELCRRKKLGLDPARRQRDRTVLARAGYSFDVIRCVL